MTSAVTTFRPASIIVANWREKICRDFGLTFLKYALASWPADEVSSSRWARRPFWRRSSRAESASGAFSSPDSSKPWALMAEYAKVAIHALYRQRDADP